MTQTQTWSSAAAPAGTLPWPQVARRATHNRLVLPPSSLQFPISSQRSNCSTSLSLLSERHMLACYSGFHCRPCGWWTSGCPPLPAPHSMAAGGPLVLCPPTPCNILAGRSLQVLILMRPGLLSLLLAFVSDVIAENPLPDLRLLPAPIISLAWSLS